MPRRAPAWERTWRVQGTSEPRAAGMLSGGEGHRRWCWRGNMTFVLSDTGSRTGSERMSGGLWLEFSKAPFGP